MENFLPFIIGLAFIGIGTILWFLARWLFSAAEPKPNALHIWAAGLKLFIHRKLRRLDANFDPRMEDYFRKLEDEKRPHQ